MKISLDINTVSVMLSACAEAQNSGRVSYASVRKLARIAPIIATAAVAAVQDPNRREPEVEQIIEVVS